MKANFIFCNAVVFFLCFLTSTECSPLSFSNICEFGYVFNGTHCEECGVSQYAPNVRIVGGRPAEPYSWPAQVLIRQSYKYFYENKYRFETFMCGGTLINRNVVLTAAHCLAKEFEYITETGDSVLLKIEPNTFHPTIESTFSVYAGIHNLTFLYSSFDPPSPGQRLRVSKIITHPLYNDSTSINDIALFILEQPAEINSYTGLGCLPYEYSTQFPSINQPAWAAGWGTLESEGVTPDELYNVRLKIYEESKCHRVFDFIPKNWSSQLCAGEYKGGKDTCQGDSGGALYTFYQSRYVVSGLVSYGEGCGYPERPGIYTRVSAFLDWIYESQNITLPLATSTSTRSTSTKQNLTAKKPDILSYLSQILNNLWKSVYSIFTSIFGKA